MAKLFYTLEEAAAKLGQSAEEVRELASSGRIQEFRDRDKLMFKVDQIDLLAVSLGQGEPDDADMSSMIPLADSALGDMGLAGSSPGMSGPGMSSLGASKAESFGGDKIDLLAESAPGLSGAAKSGTRSGLNINESSKAKSKSGVSIFDADDLERADSGVAAMGSGSGLDDLSLEPVGSGSGLMELTRESDDTSLGAAEFLQEVGDDTTPDLPAGASGLFRAQPEESEALSSPATLVAASAAGAIEPFDGPGSGLVGGLCVGAVAALAIGVAVALVSMSGGADSSDGLTGALASNFMIVVGAMAGVTVIGGAVGFFLGKRA